MATPRKEKLVNSLEEKLSSAKGVYLADFMGLNVEEISNLRNLLRRESIEFKVVKNTLVKRSTDKLGLGSLNDYLSGPTAMAFCLADPIAAAKILVDYQKKNEKLKLKAFVLDGQIYDKSRVEEIAKLPSKDQIVAQTLGIISAPLRNIVGVLNSLVTSMVIVLSEIKKQREN
ncbi:MAG TPA: 50S ribosomal protein L10 [bacterium]